MVEFSAQQDSQVNVLYDSTLLASSEPVPWLREFRDMHKKEVFRVSIRSLQ